MVGWGRGSTRRARADKPGRNCKISLEARSTCFSRAQTLPHKVLQLIRQRSCSYFLFCSLWPELGKPRPRVMAGSPWLAFHFSSDVYEISKDERARGLNLTIPLCRRLQA